MKLRTVEEFFTDRTLVADRGYNWSKRNVDDLIDDLQRSVNDREAHFLGLMVLVPTRVTGEFSVAVGGRRVIALTLLLRRLIGLVANKESQSELVAQYLGSPDAPRLRLAAGDHDYLLWLLRSRIRLPDNDTQRAMGDTHRRIRERTLSAAKTASIDDWLRWATRMQIVECIAEDEEHARWIEYVHFARGLSWPLAGHMAERPPMRGHLDIPPIRRTRRKPRA